MELQIIRHKSASDYFRDFFPEDTAAAYSYQLQRMFESGAAKEGDYFLVTDGGRSYLQAEIYRNNTRRIWERAPVISPKAVFDKEKNTEAIRMIFDFLKSDEYYFNSADRLEVIITEDTGFSEIMKSFAEEFGYKKIADYIEFSIKLSAAPEAKIIEEISCTPLSAMEPEDRFMFVLKHDEAADYFGNVDPVLLYQDYLDEGYFSEELWQIILFKGEVSGFMMPIFTSGYKDKIRLQNYCIINEEAEKKISEAVIAKMISIATEHQARKLEFAINSSDDFLIKEIEITGAEKTKKTTRYLKK